mgnify:CR=1 FL=1
MNYTTAMKAVNNSKFTFLADGNLRVDNAAIMFKNFSGKPTNLNPAGGKRTFALVLTKEFGDILKGKGWNVKDRTLDDGETIYYTEIVVNDQSTYPPRIYKLSEFMGNKSMVLMNPDQYFKLDQDNLVNIDMDIHPYTHNRGFDGATKGYLKNMWASVESINDFGGKYAAYQLVES